VDKTLTVTRIDHINGRPMTPLGNWTGHESSVSFYGKDLGNVIVRGMMETATPLTK